MATLTINGTDYTVNYAVKGNDFIHGYVTGGICIVSVEGVTDFSNISYNDTYMSPESCVDERSNIVRKVNGTFTESLKANATDASSTQIRNMYAGTEDMEAGVTDLVSGSVYFVYE